MILFFNSSYSIKDSVRRQPNNSRGFADNELTKQKMDMKEVFDVGQELYHNLSELAAAEQALDGENFWPIDDSLIHFREIVEAYYEECKSLSEILIEAMLTALNCESTRYIKESFHQHSSFLRLNYYPVVNAEMEVSTDGSLRDERLGVSRHTDAGALTILMQDRTPGLEVYSGSKQDFNDGEWISVQPIQRALTINTGDMLAVWSNDLFKAPEHRVKASRNSQRYSIPFFYNPNYDTLVAPICNNENPKYKGIRWGQYRTTRFLGDFENIGKEIQIEDFRI
jgi:isopenicillin N synthase-like dioxygenase